MKCWDFIIIALEAKKTNFLGLQKNTESCLHFKKIQK